MVVVVLGLTVAWVIRGNDVAVAEAGRPAPDFTVPLIGGGSFTLSEQLAAEEKPIVLNLWASWCIPCRTEMPELSSFARANPDVKVIGVAVEDTRPEAEAFAAEINPSFDLAFGDRVFEAAYPRLGLPATYIIDAGGTVAEVFNGMVTEELLETLVFGADS